MGQPRGRRFPWPIAAIRIPSHFCRQPLPFCQPPRSPVPLLRLPRRRRPQRRGWVLAWALAAWLSPGLIPSARALELQGATYFAKAPWKVDLVSFYTTIWQTRAEYYFTLSLDPEAGAALGGLTIQQTRGVDTRFPFFVERTSAFLGRPRREGAKVPVEARFDSAARLFTLTFPEPVPPGATVTVVLKPWNNPAFSDTYMFQVTAFPAGPNPSPAPLGFGTLRIYDLDWP
ncbi:DUF2808 domain-containing protein [Cyanobium sp. FACHB-13342]|nr:DUF2808 domain-containing protein [Cyanobium sp. FACHB-13342]